MSVFDAAEDGAEHVNALARIELKTAGELGTTISPALMIQARELIE